MYPFADCTLQVRLSITLLYSYWSYDSLHFAILTCLTYSKLVLFLQRVTVHAQVVSTEWCWWENLKWVSVFRMYVVEVFVEWLH